MAVPIVGERTNPYIVVEMIPGLNPGTFDIQLDTQHFPSGVPLAAQCLLQATMYLLPHAYQAIATAAVQQLIEQQKTQRNGES